MLLIWGVFLSLCPEVSIARGGGGAPILSATSADTVLVDARGAYVFKTGPVGSLRVDVYGPRVFRVRWSSEEIVDKSSIVLPRSMSGFWPTPSTLSESEHYYRVGTEEVEVRVSRTGDLRVDFYDRKTGQPLCLGSGMSYDESYNLEDDPSYKSSSKTLEPPSGYRVRVSKKAPIGECYLGLGDWGGPLNRRGSTLQFWNEDAWGWTERRNPKYTTMPIYHAIAPAPLSHLYTIFLNNSSRSMFDMSSSNPDELWFQVSEGIMDYFLVAGGTGSISGAMKTLSELTGPAALLPKWAYGYHMSKFTYTQREIENMVSAHRGYRIPLSAVFIDLDYMDQGPSTTDNEWVLVQFKWGPAYPSPQEMISKLEADGIASVVIVESFVSDEDPKFAIAEKEGFFIRKPDGTPCLIDLWCAERSGWVDYTSPTASRWWIRELSSFLGDYGLSGVWNDLNETADRGRIPLSALYDMGEGFPATPSLRSLNKLPRDRRHSSNKALYALYNSRTSYEAQRIIHPTHRPYVLSRGAFPGVQRWAASWSGDNLSDPDHLRCNIRVGTSMGISGLSNYGHDVGGFSGDPSPEVMERWQEWAVFSPSMRNHYSKSSVPREIYRFPPASTLRLTGTVLQRYYLLPTLYSLARQSVRTGWPINAPVPSVFPGDPTTYYASENDIMVGRSLLTAPVVEVGAESRTVYLPDIPGGWFSLWGDHRFSPGWHEVSAPLGQSPAFLRAGSFLVIDPRPLSPDRPWGKDVTDWSELEIHAWPGGSGYFWLYDDDGKTALDYPDSSRISVRIHGIHAGNKWVVWLTSDVPLGGRTLTLVLRGTADRPGRVLVNGIHLPILSGSPPRVPIKSPDRPLSTLVEIFDPVLSPPKASSEGPPSP